MYHPEWLKVRLNTNSSFHRIKQLNQRLNLHTVCEQAACPNIGYCWSKNELTYILLAKFCTRTCRFCNVAKSSPQAIDPEEPERISQAIKELGLDYVVLTSVTRDDLQDKGLSHFLRTITLIKNLSPRAKVEILIPDFGNLAHLLEKISCSETVVIGHNIETVRDLYPELRPLSNYDASLNVLKSLKVFNPSCITKSAIMLGLGEDEEKILQTMRDLKEVGLDILYLGQYLSPSKAHWPVKRFYTPDEFDYFKHIAQSLGFKTVVSEPLARSSWRAKEAYKQVVSLAAASV